MDSIADVSTASCPLSSPPTHVGHCRRLIAALPLAAGVRGDTCPSETAMSPSLEGVFSPGSPPGLVAEVGWEGRGPAGVGGDGGLALVLDTPPKGKGVQQAGQVRRRGSQLRYLTEGYRRGEGGG